MVIGTSFMESAGDWGFDAIFPLEALSDCALNNDEAMTEVEGPCTGGSPHKGQNLILRLAQSLRANSLFPCSSRIFP